MFEFFVLFALLTALAHFSREGLQRAGLISTTLSAAWVVALGLVLASANFWDDYFSRFYESPNLYFDYRYGQYALGSMVLAAAIWVALRTALPNLRGLWITGVAALLGFYLAYAGVLYGVGDVMVDPALYFERLAFNLFTLDHASSPYFLRSAAVYVSANAVVLYLLFARNSKSPSAPTTTSIGENVVSFKSSTNEPARLILGQAAVGRLKFVDELRQQDEHPCQAMPLSMDVTRKAVLKVADARADEDVKYHTYYILASIAVFILVANELFGVALAPILVAGIIYYKRLYRDRYEIAARYAPGAFKETEEVRPSYDNHNLVVFQGYAPFTNFGIPFGTWTLTVDTKRANKDALASSSLTEPDLAELEAEISEAMAKSGLLEGPGREIALVQGANIPMDVKRPGPNRPTQSIPREKLSDYATQPSSPVRRYLWFRKIEWSGELSISYFVRLFRTGDDLNLEINGVLMPPVAKNNRWVDEVSPPSFWSHISDFIGSIFGGAFMMIWSPLRFLFKVNEAIGLIFSNPIAKLTKQISRTPNYDFGAPLSVRRRVADVGAINYFQNVDRRVAEAAFAGRVTRTFIDSLDACGIDTSELRDQQTTLLNQGIVVQGGDLKAENVAAGLGAQIKSRVSGAAKKKESA